MFSCNDEVCGFFVYNYPLWLSLFDSGSIIELFCVTVVQMLCIVCSMQCRSLPVISNYCADQQVVGMHTGRQRRSTHGCEHCLLFCDEGTALNTFVRPLKMVHFGLTLLNTFIDQSPYLESEVIKCGKDIRGNVCKLFLFTYATSAADGGETCLP